MNKRIFLIIPVIILSMAMKQDKPAYKLFNEKGRTVKYKKLLKEAKDADIIFFGELHNNPICHWLQLELTQDVYNENNNLVLGAEMDVSRKHLTVRNERWKICPVRATL